MWIDETDTTQLAQRLRVGPRELIESIGGPWRISGRVPELEQEQPGTLYVGRAGPSVAILVGDEVDPEVVVGTALGHWEGTSTLQWTLGVRLGTCRVPAAAAPSIDVDMLLVALREAVDAAFQVAAPTLVTCRYCGMLVGPALAMGDQLCAACGRSIFGVMH